MWEWDGGQIRNYLGCVEHSVTTRAKLFKIVVKNNLHFIPVDMGIIEFGS